MLAETYQKVEGYIECDTEQQHTQGVKRVPPVPKVDEHYHVKQLTMECVKSLLLMWAAD
jgi:hypothetical protein